MNAEQFNNLLVKFGACPDAVKWATGKTLRQAWDECERADWLFWLLEEQQDQPGWPTEREIWLTWYDCYEQVGLPLWQKYYTDDNRPRRVIAIGRKYYNGQATREKLKKARTLAWASARALARDIALDATRALAPSTAWAAAWAAANKTMCKILRKSLGKFEALGGK